MVKIIINQFGSRTYVFKSQNDITKAYSIYVLPVGLDEFERMLKDKEIHFKRIK